MLKTAEPSLTDMHTFLALYDKAKNSPGGKPPTTFQELFGLLTDKGHTTIVDRLQRVTRFFLGNPVDKKGPGFDRLFHRPTKGSCLQTTMEAEVLAERLRGLLACYQKTKEAIAELRPNEQPPIRVGSSTSFGLWLLSHLFSGWDRFVSQEIKLKVVMGSTTILIPLMDAANLDFVFAYGEDDKRHLPQVGGDIAFRSLGYHSRMVLICHPDSQLVSKRSKQNLNEGYWNASYWNKIDQGKGQERIPYDRLPQKKQIHIDDIDFSQTPPLAVVPSWGQPKLLEAKGNELAHSGRLEQVPFYDEALALCRMGLAVAAVPEVFCLRPGVTAFRLLPQRKFTRWMGVYYNTRLGISAEACRVIDFIEKYLDAFGNKLRTGTKLPFFEDADYRQLCSENKSKPLSHWEKISSHYYPRVTRSRPS